MAKLTLKQLELNRDGLMVLPLKGIKELTTMTEFLERFKDQIYRYILKKIAFAVRNDIETIDMFVIEGTGYVLDSDYGDMEEQLVNIRSYFEAKEEYEICAIAHKLLITINK